MTKVQRNWKAVTMESEVSEQEARIRTQNITDYNLALIIINIIKSLAKINHTLN